MGWGGGKIGRGKKGMSVEWPFVTERKKREERRKERELTRTTRRDESERERGG